MTYHCNIANLILQRDLTNNIMRKIVILLALAIAMNGVAQENNAEIEEPKGKAIMEVFGNFHSGFVEDSEDRGFALERCYLGYEYKLGDRLTMKGVMDFGRSADVDDHQRIGYLKYAMVSWKTANLTLNGGLIPTTQFHFQEKFWGCRYIRKSFQDEYKFGSSADLGVSATYRFADWLCVDAIIVNGEGYKKIQVNEGLNYGLGVTLTPAKGFNIRLYGGLNESGEAGKKNTANIATFIGYRHEKFAIGAEYNYMTNTSGVEGADQSGYSVYFSVDMPRDIALFARFDDLYARNGWNNTNDESATILGIQFNLGKHVKIAPNFRVAMPKRDGAKPIYSAYLNCQFGF
jgi:hypothetical protein